MLLLLTYSADVRDLANRPRRRLLLNLRSLPPIRSQRMPLVSTTALPELFSLRGTSRPPRSSVTLPDLAPTRLRVRPHSSRWMILCSHFNRPRPGYPRPGPGDTRQCRSIRLRYSFRQYQEIGCLTREGTNFIRFSVLSTISTRVDFLGNNIDGRLYHYTYRLSMTQ